MILNLMPADDLRLFLFHTELPSGAPGFPLELKVLVEPPKLLPDFATSFRREAVEAVVPGAGEEEADPVAESGLEEAFVAPLDARKVLLTETDLKLLGFAAVDEVRTWPSLASADLWEEGSALDVSVSEPPLTLTSVEFTSSSTMSVICLFSISSGGPFRAVPEGMTF